MTYSPFPIRVVVARTARKPWPLALLTSRKDARRFFRAYQADGFTRRQAFRLAAAAVAERPLLPGERSRWYERTTKVYADQS